MIAISVASLASPVLGTARTRGLRDYCLEQILHVFAKDDRRLLFESVGRDGQVIDEPEGRVINPGHALESMWFCLEEGRRRGDSAVLARCAEIADWMYLAGYDREFGGIVSFLDANGREPPQTDWHRETNMQWHDKVWWVHSEALYACALTAMAMNDLVWFQRFLDLQDWCLQHFYDPQYGEWYPELHRDGTPKRTDKGTIWKAAYHLPRALMLIMKLFESAESSVRRLDNDPAPEIFPSKPGDLRP